MKKYKLISLVVAASTVSSVASHAADPLSISFVQNGQTAAAGYSSLSELFDLAKSESAIQQRFGTINFNADQASSSTINYLGLNWHFASSAYAGNAQSLSFSVPELGISEVFVGLGGTANDARKDAYNQLVNYLKANSGSVYTQIQKWVVAKTPNSSIAGNPGSIQTLQAAADFDLGVTSLASRVIAPGSGDARIPNLIGLGFTYGHFKQGDIETSTKTIPLSYTWRSDSDSRKQVIISAPITLGSVGNAKTYAGQFSLATRIPVTKDWTLTPAVGYGLAASADLAQAAQQMSASLSSAYVLSSSADGNALAIGNMVGHYRTLKLKVDDYEFNPKVANTVFRNGVMYTIPFAAGGHKMATEFTYVNTLFTGSETYTKSQNEVGFTVGTDRESKGLASYLRGGLALVQAKNSNGWRLSFGYWF